MQQITDKQSFSMRTHLLILLAVLCLFGFPAGQVLNYSDIYREAIAEIGCMALLLYWFYKHRQSQKITLKLSFARIWLTGLFLFATLSIFWSSNIYFFISKYLLWLATAAMVFLSLGLRPTIGTYITLARGLLAVATLISVVGLMQVLFEIDVFGQVKPPSANFVNKNIAAQVIVLLFPLSLFLLFVDSHKPWTKIYPLLIALIVAYIFHTHTLAAWLSVVLQIVLITIWAVRYRKELKPAVTGNVITRPFNKSSVIVAIIALLMLLNLSEQGWRPLGGEIAKEVNDAYGRIQSGGITGRGSNRYLIWDSAWIMWQQNPLIGTGMGSFYHNLITQPENYSAEGDLRAHNDLLELGVELGCVGWFLFLAAVISLLSALYKLTSRGDMQQQIFYLSLAAALAGSAFNMQLSFPYQMPVPLIIFGLYVGLIVSGSDAYNSHIKNIELSLRPWYWNIKIAGIGLILILVLAINLVWIGVFAKISENIKRDRWRGEIISNPLMCHKTIVKSLHDSSISYTRQGLYRASLGTIDSFAQCVPNTWLYENVRSINLISLHQYQAAIAILEKAKQHGPKGTYMHYLNQFLAYIRIKDRQGARQVYQQLRAQPEALLAARKVTLRKLVIMALNLDEVEQAMDIYQLHQKYHGKNTDLEERIASSLARQKR